MAFSLLELMAVVTLTGLLLTISLVNMQAVSDQSCLQAAADQISTAYRLAAMEATRTGRPHALRLASNTCSIQRPELVDGHWIWGNGAVFELPQKVRIESVDVDKRSPDADFRFVPVGPDDWNGGLRVHIRVPGGAPAAFEIGLHRTVLQLTDFD